MSDDFILFKMVSIGWILRKSPKNDSRDSKLAYLLLSWTQIFVWSLTALRGCCSATWNEQVVVVERDPNKFVGWQLFHHLSQIWMIQMNSSSKIFKQSLKITTTFDSQMDSKGSTMFAPTVTMDKINPKDCQVASLLVIFRVSPIFLYRLFQVMTWQTPNSPVFFGPIFDPWWQAAWLGQLKSVGPPSTGNTDEPRKRPPSWTVWEREQVDGGWWMLGGSSQLVSG